MLHIVIARDREDLSWVDSVPDHCTVTIHNRGEALDPSAFEREVTILPAAPASGAAGSVLAHLRHERLGALPDDQIVFTHGDPLAHAPGFLQLLQAPHRWGEVQPLSVHGREQHPMPPARLVEQDVRDWIGALPVRPERYSLRTLAPINHFDDTALRLGDAWQRKQGLPEGTNLIAHFLGLCGLQHLAEDAEDADLGIMAHGPVWAVRQSRVDDFRSGALAHFDKIDVLLRADVHCQSMLDRCWLHLFGLPFIAFEALPRPVEEITPMAASMAKVVASIDAVLARSVPAARATPRRSRPLQAGSAVDLLHRQACEAARLGHDVQAQSLLHQALQNDPQYAPALADAAALACQRGDVTAAIPLSRRALLADPGHAGALYTLAMSLAVTGPIDEAVALLDGITRDEAYRDFREQQPDLIELAQQQLLRLLAHPRAPMSGAMRSAA